MDTVTVITSNGEEFKLSRDVAAGSSFVRMILDQTPDSTEAVHVPTVHSREFVVVLSFLEKNAVTPVTRLRRPLPRPSLESSEAPGWAIEFAKSIPLGTSTLDLIEAASFLGIRMLEQLLCARIAAEIARLPRDVIQTLRTTVSDDMRDADGSQRRLTAAEEKLLKEQNRWAWENEITDVIAE